MVYVIVDSKGEGRVLLVKADSEEDIKQVMILSEAQKIMGRFTANEISTLQTSSFAVIS